MFAKDQKYYKKTVVRMDPDCAICNAPATLNCVCEANALETAVRQAEHRAMSSKYQDIRVWVRSHAQDYILEYFSTLAERRKVTHSQHLDRITAEAYYHYKAPPHPRSIADAEDALKKGIDEDWRKAVQRYPEVLEYFFSLTDLSMPDDSDPAVTDPPLRGSHGNSVAWKTHHLPGPPEPAMSGGFGLPSSGYFETSGASRPPMPSRDRRSGSGRSPGASRGSYRDYAGAYIASSRHR